tara:strand:- start:66 stop:704 length:639 start_codon:yes stop_codon:yes gene_type:complete
MRAKDVEFEVTFINLLEKPEWFLKISPHGKVPVLKVGNEVLFESNAIAEFLDETVPPRLHPENAVERARNRAWTDFVPSFASALTGIYYTKTQAEMEQGLTKALKVMPKVEEAIAAQRQLNNGPYFNGSTLSLVDAAYAPFLQRFMIVDKFLKTKLLEQFPLLKEWTDFLITNELVTGAVAPEFLEAFLTNLRRRNCYVATLIEESKTQAAE